MGSEEIDVDAAADRVIDECEKPVQDYKDGDDGAIGYLVGQLMEETGGAVRPSKANELLRERLDT